MSLEQERLLSLIDYTRKSAVSKAAPVSTVEAYQQFALYEHQLQGKAGIRLNVDTAEGDDELWLVVDRLHETKPPTPKSSVLSPWLELTQGPDNEPKLKPSVDADALVAAGTHRLAGAKVRSPSDHLLPELPPRTLVHLAEYAQLAAVQAHFKTYLEGQWKPWAEEERPRRWVIRLYGQLFTLKQKLEGAIVETELELVWGVGQTLWQKSGARVSFPLITRTVELSLNPITAAIEIRPRDADPRLETDWFASDLNPGVADVEKKGREFFDKASATLSPFDRGSFEPILQAAVTLLDPSGVYWPNVSPVNDRSLPPADDKLKLTDTWVLFARPRSNNLLVQDLENLRRAIEASGDDIELPGAVAAVVTDPATDNPVVELPTFRGVSVSYQGGDGATSGGAKVRDLYFPKPFNEEQIRIVQLLEVSNGVVVQGPPGTGKTHTIANVICHYLANGKRVLVTSMKDPALAVLQEKLPTEIQPLAISLLTSEQEGLKQFEHAIHKIASETQGLDRQATARRIGQLQETIDSLHGKLARIDRSVTEWARKNLERVNVDGADIDPQDAAREVVDGEGHYEWLPDRVDIAPVFSPQFSDEDIVSLRNARRVLGADMSYLGCSLPQLVEFPNARQLLQVHQDLSRFSVLTREVEVGEVPSVADSSAETLNAAASLLAEVERLTSLQEEITSAQRRWTETIAATLRSQAHQDLVALLEALGKELDAAKNASKAFLVRPVEMPRGFDDDADLVGAIENLAHGKAPFGLAGLFGKAEQKRQLAEVRVLGDTPGNVEDWLHVADWVQHQRTLRALALRWNTLAPELRLDQVGGAEPRHGLEAAHQFELYQRVKTLVAVQRQVGFAATKVFPSWVPAHTIGRDLRLIGSLETSLRHHLTKNRLADVWAVKERFQQVLVTRSGPVVDRVREFLADTLGNPAVGDADMQARWSALMAELARVSGLAGELYSVAEITERIAASGAPEYARLLRQPLGAATDPLLPDEWRRGWRLRRLATYVESIDAQDHLKQLAKERVSLENDLARAYQDVVVSRTWLRLAENASPSIRAALQAYLNAIQKIGKGTGKRAVRYRRDARAAARQANPAVPCWIMPHFRVSEALPPELGCFDLVIIDEASQSDFTALPALLRAKKVLIVGDDKQVSPEGVGLDEEKLNALMNQFLRNQVPIFRPQMSQERSIYDLFKVVFARSSVMLKEHFRCVAPIIEYSKREFYNNEIRPLRVPRASERLDPPLIDVLVEDGYRDGDINRAEIRFIVDEIRHLTSDHRMTNRSIGVVSLLGSKQAIAIWDTLTQELGTELLQHFDVSCGDARTFQGKERNVMFLTMVAAPNDVGAPPTRDTFAQRYNVATSRAMDRMYLVRSVDHEHLSAADKLRRSLLSHFTTPFAQDEQRVEELRKLCESPFEREVYDELTVRGYWVRPQVKAGQYRIDMVVEGHNDSRLAVECDGDKYHGPDKWPDDMQRQRVLERAGWVFWRSFASSFVRRRRAVMDDLLKTLRERGVEPLGSEGAPRSVHTEHRRYRSEKSSQGIESPENAHPTNRQIGNA